MTYQEMLQLLAAKKLAHQNSDQDFQDEEYQPQQDESSPFPEDPDDDDTMLAKLRELVNKKKNLKQT